MVPSLLLGVLEEIAALCQARCPGEAEGMGLPVCAVRLEIATGTG